MSELIRCQKVSLAFGPSQILVDQADFAIAKGERVCLIGRNGAGKSSFLKMLDHKLSPDDGHIYYAPGLKMARLEQELLFTNEHNVLQCVMSAFEQQQLYQDEPWEQQRLAQVILTELDLLDYSTHAVSSLSGGWQRKVALAKALVINPDLLLLDEPTNHLAIDVIQWLEQKLLNFNGGLLFITHDRWLLRRLATRIIELDRGQLISWPGDYDNFLRRKAENLQTEATHNKLFDKKLAQEEQWIRQGIKARRTRNEGRVRALKALRLERQQRKDVMGTAKLITNTVNQSGKLVLDAQQITYAYSNTNTNTNIIKPVINQFSLRMQRGDKIGLVGPNGVGKSTLLKILLGQLAPDQGEVILGSQLEIAYFDQTRQSLDPEQTVWANVAGGRSSVNINGKEKHVISYLKDFLFSSDRAHMCVKALSGGECNRLLLAKLFSQPANLLVLDEPTNDLDIETLELLEELLHDYHGSLLVVSHDRAFLDNIVTRLLSFEADGKIIDYIGGYQDYLLKESLITSVDSVADSTANIIESTNITNQANITDKNKLSYVERKELAKLPQKVEKLEQQQQQLFATMSEAGFYDQDEQIVQQITMQLKQLEQDIEQLYLRWDNLESFL